MNHVIEQNLGNDLIYHNVGKGFLSLYEHVLVGVNILFCTLFHFAFTCVW